MERKRVSSRKRLVDMGGILEISCGTMHENGGPQKKHQRDRWCKKENP